MLNDTSPRQHNILTDQENSLATQVAPSNHESSLAKFVVVASIILAAIALLVVCWTVLNPGDLLSEPKHLQFIVFSLLSFCLTVIMGLLFYHTIMQKISKDSASEKNNIKFVVGGVATLSVAGPAALWFGMMILYNSFILEGVESYTPSQNISQVYFNIQKERGWLSYEDWKTKEHLGKFFNDYAKNEQNNLEDILETTFNTAVPAVKINEDYKNKQIFMYRKISVNGKDFWKIVKVQKITGVKKNLAPLKFFNEKSTTLQNGEAYSMAFDLEKSGKPICENCPAGWNEVAEGSKVNLLQLTAYEDDMPKHGDLLTTRNARYSSDENSESEINIINFHPKALVISRISTWEFSPIYYIIKGKVPLQAMPIASCLVSEIPKIPTKLESVRPNMVAPLDCGEHFSFLSDLPEKAKSMISSSLKFDDFSGMQAALNNGECYSIVVQRNPSNLETVLNWSKD